MVTPFCFCLLGLGPLGTLRSLGKTPTFEPATPHRAPKPRKACTPARQRPQIILQVFSYIFTISTLRPSSQDFRIFWQTRGKDISVSQTLSVQLFNLPARFSGILVSIKDFSKKQASQLLSCRGGLGEALYNTPRHSLQRCRSKALKDMGIRKLT